VNETQADRNAAQLRERFEKAGWKVTVNVTDYEPTRYGDGRVMTSGFRSVGLTAQSPRWYDGTLHTHWMSTTTPREGCKRTTKWHGGTYYPLTGKRKELRTRQSLAIWIDVILTGYEGEEGR
jgi:hypothetical protein